MRLVIYTESIWPKIIILNFRSHSHLQVGRHNVMILIFLIRSYSTVYVRRCHTLSVKFNRSCSSVWSFRSCTNFLVIFIWSCWFDQIIYPPLKVNPNSNIYLYFPLKIDRNFTSPEINVSLLCLTKKKNFFNYFDKNPIESNNFENTF